MPNQLSLSCALAFGIAFATSAPAAARTLSGKLWIIPANSSASFPPPSATPDVTFTIRQAVFSGQGPNTRKLNINQCYTVSTFLNSVTHPSNISYSGLTNSVIHAVVSGNTLISDDVINGPVGTYETEIELTGEVKIKRSQAIEIAHDDGAALQIDGTNVPGFSGNDGRFMEEANFTGRSGQHAADLLYIAHGGADELLFGLAP